MFEVYLFIYLFIHLFIHSCIHIPWILTRLENNMDIETVNRQYSKSHQYMYVINNKQQ